MAQFDLAVVAPGSDFGAQNSGTRSTGAAVRKKLFVTFHFLIDIVDT